MSISGKDVKSIFPAISKAGAFEPFQPDLYKNSGNIPPSIEPLTAAEEAEYLKNVKVPEGFRATLFAAPPAVNYPVFVAAAPDGTLYVSSDGNGSLGRNPDRGRVIRLRDTDGDGRADETKVFCKVDAPRGLVWDYDRLYLVHPPHLSVFIDKDRDGVADEQKILVRDIAFDYDKRPADHTTNGLSLGVDGYLYIAGGDFGFMDAVGTDGTHLQHRGGGVIRVRPDGSGLELHSTGTRNILEVAISPRMDLFARDNTNDGGGWDVRFHHFTGGEDHGYPRLYKNFNDECVQPLADYGGGSGCGAAYLDEPGFGDWNDAPLTADWGRGAIYHHQVRPRGATFVETREPEPLVRMTRPTDADVDGVGGLYAASWRGATFNWTSPNVGFIVRVTPTDFKPTPLPDFVTLSREDLIAQMDSPSYRRRLAAQRELIRRRDDASELLIERISSHRTPERNLIDHLRNDATAQELITSLNHDDSVVQHTAIQELARRSAFAECFAALDAGSRNRKAIARALAMMHRVEVVDGLIARVESSSNIKLIMDILPALCRLHFREGSWTGQSWGTRPDTRGPYYQPEPWSETEKIAAALRDALKSLSPSDAATLIGEMNRNRIESDDATSRLIELAASQESLLPELAIHIANSGKAPAQAYPLLVGCINQKHASMQAITAAAIALTRYDREESVASVLKSLEKLESLENARRELDRIRREFAGSSLAQNQLQTLSAASDGPSRTSFWADTSILDIVARKNASPETVAACNATIEKAWRNVKRRQRLIEAATTIGSHFLDERIIVALRDSNSEVAKAAELAVAKLKISMTKSVGSPMVVSMDRDAAIRAAIETRGDANLGQQLFTKANCNACHTVSKDVPQKGPYLGSIAATYKRPELVTAILEPSKTIAQGFATTNIVTLDGQSIAGFVTRESADEVVLRTAEAKEFVIAKDDIDFRKTTSQSVMPDGLMQRYTIHDVASIVDYLQELAKDSKAANGS